MSRRNPNTHSNLKKSRNTSPLIVCMKFASYMFAWAAHGLCEPNFRTDLRLEIFCLIVCLCNVHKSSHNYLCNILVDILSSIWYYNNVKRECDGRLRETFLKEIKVIWRNLLTNNIKYDIIIIEKQKVFRLVLRAHPNKVEKIYR